MMSGRYSSFTLVLECEKFFAQMRDSRSRRFLCHSTDSFQFERCRLDVYFFSTSERNAS